MSVRTTVSICAAGLALAGCGTWLGDPEDPPLPGERISVMLLDESITPDPSLAAMPMQLPQPVRNPDWPQSFGNPQHAMQHAALGDPLGIAWQVDIGAGNDDGDRLLGTPVVANGLVHAIDAAGIVSTYSSANGALLWRSSPIDTSTDRLRGGGLATADGRLFVATAGGHVISLDASSGDELWRRSVEAPMRVAPTVIGNLVLALTSLNQLVALDAGTGNVVWQHAGFYEPAAILGGAAPASDGRAVLAAYSSGEIFALEAASGRPIWSEAVLRPRRTLAIGSINDITGAPVVHQGQVLVAGNGGEMVGLELASGGRNWEVELTSLNTPWVAGDYAFVITDNNEVVSLSVISARARWVTPLERFSDPENPDSARVFWAGPVLAGNRLILAGSTGEAVLLSPVTGAETGRLDLPGSTSLPPIVADGTLFFLTDSATLVAYR